MADINISFVSRDEEKIEALKLSMHKRDGFRFSFIQEDLEDVSGMNVNVFVSPANSFGELEGGVDMIYYKSFGRKKLQQYVYSVIQDKYEGEIVIGDCALINLSRVDLEYRGKYLLLCPTMTIPMDVRGTRNAYFFAKAMLKGLKMMKSLGIDVKNVLCPIPCVGVGQMDYQIAAKQISVAFDANEKKGLIYAIYGNEKHKHPEYSDSVLQNARMTCIQMTKKN